MAALPTTNPPTDRERCAACGYDVRGLDFSGGMALCPECGQGIDSEVLGEIPRLRRPFIAALALPLVSFGLYTWVPAYQHLLDTNAPLKVFFHLGLTVLPAPILFTALNGKRWRLLPRGRRRLLVEGFVFWLICSAVLLAFALNWSVVIADARLALGLP